MTSKNQFSNAEMLVDIFPSLKYEKKDTLIIPKLSHGVNLVTIVTGKEDVNNCDAVVTENKRLSLGIKIADCAPICFSDGKRIGIAHIGWRGLCLGLIETMLTQFDKNTLSVYVGPFLHSFQIQKDFCYDSVYQKFENLFFVQEDDKLLFNFRDAVASLLPVQTIYDHRNTEIDFSFPSYRRNKTKDRFATVVSFK